MGLNKAKGNMYQFIDMTWNPIKGECSHKCSYCYMSKWGKQRPIRLDEKEFKEFIRDYDKLDKKPFIFIGSSTDMFAQDVPNEWINKILYFIDEQENKRPANWLFQTKNPEAINDNVLPQNSVVCTTIETNRLYPEIIKNAPVPYQRAMGMYCIRLPRYVTIEPIMDFDLEMLVQLIIGIEPEQVNIGADSGGNNLPEPSKEKTELLIKALKTFTTVKLKKNLNRIIKS